ncbi:MAG: response regulator transcription factor [Planctomycetes bacterium]|nr:response regulator transcription factor [Planctomycetota bacterium]MCB9871828.1 response regulator transcription factor [Planctomycetota bacterium]
MRIRVVLVDDHKVVRDGLRVLLAEQHDLEVVGEADHGREALRVVAETETDVVVMDFSMPELNGVEATRRIVGQHPRTRVVALSMYHDRKLIGEMLRVGALGFVSKECVTATLVSAIRSAHDGVVYVAPDLIERYGDVFLVPPGAALDPEQSVLSPREQEVLQLVAEGRTTKEIAGRLEISAKTVDTHRQNIMKKLNMRTVAELTKYAVRERITPLDP